MTCWFCDFSTKKDLENCDDILVKAVNDGKEKAFETLFHKYYASLCFFANKYLQDEEAARDVVQEVFIGFYQRTVNFPNLIALKSYLYECVQHRALNLLEKRNIRAVIHQKLEIETVTENDYFYHQIETELFEEIFTAIEELPAACRTIFKMSYVENMETREISKQLKISEATIKTQRQRAKKYLKKRLENLYSIVLLLFFP